MDIHFNEIPNDEGMTKIATCKKEARETTFFIRMNARAVPELREEAKLLWQEAKELHLIFAKIYHI